ncbi:hypothetical protein V495_00055 [Pseudogymnoascus sp. VKM F-4514 (FW-929)]|nr:hypothetical protein V495_00055 [Pseudogymnoascus sp. VKM F-4514 (FW-929)]KFY67975.1 hypothetical protein V497_00110 [Pseudogymnoascus sp. VKM F-4516 (FW-969)]
MTRRRNGNLPKRRRSKTLLLRRERTRKRRERTKNKTAHQEATNKNTAIIEEVTEGLSHALDRRIVAEYNKREIQY